MYLGKIVSCPEKRAAVRKARPIPTPRPCSPPCPRSTPAQKGRGDPEGDVPSPVNPPSGCRFHTRCRHAMPRVQRRGAGVQQLEDGRWAGVSFVLTKVQWGQVKHKKDRIRSLGPLTHRTLKKVLFMKPTDAQGKTMFTLITGAVALRAAQAGPERHPGRGAGHRPDRRADRTAGLNIKPRVIPWPRARRSSPRPGRSACASSGRRRGGRPGRARRRSPFQKSPRAGVTTVVGLLGTDDVSRRPETLLAKAMQLEQEGFRLTSTAALYQLLLATITGSLRKDIGAHPKVVGVGERWPVSDTASSQPSFDELCTSRPRRGSRHARVGKAGSCTCTWAGVRHRTR